MILRKLVRKARPLLGNSLRPRFMRAVPDKVASRASHVIRSRESSDARQWAVRRAIAVSEFLQEVDPRLAAEAAQVADDLRARAERLRQKGTFVFRTQGDASLLYFLVRHYRPATVVETGVAAGFSSAAILRALDANGGDGMLWSSDLPYIRMKRPEQLVGSLVEAHLRNRWSLHLDGDRRNLRRIVHGSGLVSLFHYDSDKSYRGRHRAYEALRPVLTDHAVLVFDDIEDNFHFRDLAFRLQRDFVILRSVEKKYVGLVPPSSPSGASAPV